MFSLMFNKKLKSNASSSSVTDRVAEYSDEDEEGEFSSGEFNDETNELGITGYDAKRDYNPAKHDVRKYRKLQRSEVEDVALGPNNPVDSDSEFEIKDKSSSRAKISRVSVLLYYYHILYPIFQTHFYILFIIIY